ncbi:MIP/aquaporin family protein [Portibacter marinus]|uniref:MIP/aquaporin family protein n=1 Tax=Portibacter marinus TaxID=2898660 RepID=UPI001F253DB8|nr:MIP/aquaporin family protein [Portibacter marinus]
MSPFIAEIIGTMLLILLGNGVVANALLNKTKGGDAGIVGIAIAWGLAVYVGVLVAGPYSGAHLNPAVSIGLAFAGKFEWSEVPMYILGQCIGAALGSILKVASYYDHYKATDDLDLKLFTFANMPAISNPIPNLITELVGTFVLVFSVLYIVGPELEIDGQTTAIGLGSLGALPVALIVIVIGFSLGGPTGYAINPARDFIPRIMHSILPIGEKRDGLWSYSWIPVVGPILGGIIAAGIFLLLQ